MSQTNNKKYVMLTYHPLHDKKLSVVLYDSTGVMQQKHLEELEVQKLYKNRFVNVVMQCPHLIFDFSVGPLGNNDLLVHFM